MLDFATNYDSQFMFRASVQICCPDCNPLII